MKNFPAIFPVLILFIYVALLFSGCLSMKAEAWHQNADDAEPHVHEVGFDTRDLVPGHNNANEAAA